MSARKPIMVLALLSISVALFGADDPFIGTWKLNVAQSKFDPGPPPKSLIQIYKPFGKDGLRSSMILVNQEGKEIRQNFTVKYDGKPYSKHYFEGHPTSEMITLKRIDRYTVEGTYGREGKIRATFRRMVSQDGKTMTITSQGTTSAELGEPGLPTQDIRIYERQ